MYEIIDFAGFPLTTEIAENLFAAISTDTGSFQYPNTTARTYEIAAALIGAGVNVGALSQKMYESYPLRRVYLLRGLKLESCRGLKRAILLVTEKVAAWCSQVVLCNSESMRNEALALGIAPANKLKVLGDGSSNGVDLERFSPCLLYTSRCV